MILPAAVSYEGSTWCRTIWLQLFFSLLVFSLFCDTTKKVPFSVPPKLEAGVFVGRVNMKRCLKCLGFIGSNNLNFTILEDGSLYTKNGASLSSNENTITIFLKSIHENEQKKIHDSLLRHPKKTPTEARYIPETILRRSKRRWVPVPTTIMENSLGPFPMQIQQLSSDTALKYDIKYSISGPGVDKPPLNYFYIEKETGSIFVTRPIDREVYPEFQIICYAMTPYGYTPETPLVHTIKIEDDNDNAPVFDHDVYTFHLLENSRIGTLAGQVTASDRDEPSTLHSRVKYKIVSQNRQPYHSSSVFAIHPDSGSITVASLDLDRETTSIYTLEIEARDMEGQEFGLCGRAELIIEIGDVNDNFPQFVQTMYEVQMFENTENIEVLHIPVRDDDEAGTPSWLATFTIIKGNEDKIFSITIDRETNVGLLAALKGLDYEITKERRLEITVDNEAPYALTSSSRGRSTNTATVVVRIRDQDEGPVFETCEYILHVKECLPSGTVVGNYLARDPETGNSEGISYRILNDQCNWIAIDHTGQLRTTNILDREAPNMEHSECNITVCATDPSGKTGTGKIVIKLIDENDNYPVIITKNYIMCKDKKPICITAFDADLPPYTMPFHFDIKKPEGLTWRITSRDDESALLSLEEDINYGFYRILLRIYDNGGNSGISEVTVHYCNCVISSECSERSTDIPLDFPVDRRPSEEASNASFSPWAILASVLGSILLLSGLITPFGIWIHRKVPTTPVVLDDIAFQNLIISNTEAPGEELTDLKILPVNTMNATVSMSTVAEKSGRQGSLEVIKGGGYCTPEVVKGGGSHRTHSLWDLERPLHNSYRDLSLEWQNFTNPHLAEKVFLCGQDEEHKHDAEYVHQYHYEGKGSPVGSLSSCTGQSEEEELDFLNQPETPFKTLVEAFVNK
ncbi:desmocollin-1-like [Hemicordylus capensis]|uniref:desmocollin-1-like n=1 Tax=Hemicordylus capensis TaxID=884348 RepID=UPI002302D938|nr:desmocollin-1-like [Hemicordylus capensis]